MENKIRVLWLLNHSTLRKFEAKQLNSLGIEEIFMPKSFPYNEGNLSANIDSSYDQYLTIPESSLAILNQQDWYGSPSDDAWEIVNKYFDVAIIGFFPEQIKSAVVNFKGAVVLRVFGLSKGFSYSDLIYSELGPQWIDRIKKMGKRFWFGAGYEHLSDCEHEFMQAVDCFLPVGLDGEDEAHLWQGNEKKILFVCPRIGSSPYFENIYKQFTKDFLSFNYTIGGAQPVPVNDNNVIGYVSREQHDFNMKQHRVMYYHSTEPNHVHYHPFEAIQSGMPLVFMAGGMLDTMGGIDLPGRCKTIGDARKKIRRILNGDQKLISRIRQSQTVLLHPMKASNCAPEWKSSFQKIVKQLTLTKKEQASRPIKKKRVAIIIPIGYRGGSLRGAKLLAEAIYIGSRQSGEDVEMVFLHLDDDESYPEEEFDDMPKEIQRRPYQWTSLTAEQSRTAMRYAGHQEWEPGSDYYSVPNDDINQVLDCDLWVVVSDRLSSPLLPIRPIIHMVYDYLQRYVPILPHGHDQPYLNVTRAAEKILVTTEFSCTDALQYAGVNPKKLSKVPMLAPGFSYRQVGLSEINPQYFIWTTNAAPHKNHINAYKALRLYYEEFGGSLKCFVTGVETKKILKNKLAHLAPLKALSKQSQALRKNIQWLGELPDVDYQRKLRGAAFLWHAGKIDNGTFSVIEAASMGVPALSSDYPAMREIDQQFSLNLAWMDASDPQNMAQQLKKIEGELEFRKKLLPSEAQLAEQHVQKLAHKYWEVIRQCL